MRIRLSDLAPGVNYSLQVRATDGARVSDWSRVFNLLTTSDTLAPKVPASVVGSMTGTSFNLSWAAVTQSSDNSNAYDLDHYEVLVASGGTGVTKVYNTADTKFQFTFEMNRELFGTARANIIMSVLARDKTGNASAYSATVNQTNAAPANVTGLAGVGSVDAITLQWTANTDADLAGYEVWRSKTGSGGTYTKLWAGTGTQYTDATVDWFTDHWYRVYAVDVFGTLSASPAQTGAALRPVGAFVLDTTAPAVPAGLTATITTLPNLTGASMAVSWTAVTDTAGDLAGYRIGYRPVGASDWQYTDVDYTNTTTLIDKLTALVNYEVRIRSYDFMANFSSWSSTVTTSTAATSGTPSTPTAPTAAANTMKIQVTVPGTKAAGGAMEADVTHYEVYVSGASGFTTSSSNMVGSIRVGPSMIQDFYVPSSAGSGSTNTLYVKIIAVNSGNNKSAASAQTTAVTNLIASANISDLAVTDAKINDLTVTKLTAGSGVVNDFTIKAKLTLGDAGTDGIIEDYNYGNTGGASGFRLAKSGLIIKSGLIEAAALRLQNSPNLMPPEYADFESPKSFYIDPFWVSGGQAAIYVNNAIAEAYPASASPASLFKGKQFMAFAMPFNTNASSAYLGKSPTDYNISVEPGKTYIFSAYMRNVAPSADTWNVNIKDDTGASVVSTPFALGASEAALVRRSFAFVAPAGVSKVLAWFEKPGNTVISNLHIDGVQVEEKTGADNTPSPWKPPGSTTIDGSGVTTGYLRSNQNITVAGTELPAWSLNTQGNMQVGDALVRGKLVVGTVGETPVNIAPNGGDMETNVTGYSVFQLGATGTSIARTTTGGEVIEGTGSAKVVAAAGSKTRLGISFAPQANGTGTTLPADTIIRVTASVKVNTTDAGSTLRVVYWNPSVVAYEIVDLVSNPVAGQVYELEHIHKVASGETLALVSFAHAGTLTTTSFIADNIKMFNNQTVGVSYVSSPDYTATEAGWRISGDGSAEFNNGIFRGTLGANMVTGDTLSGNIVLASTFIAGEELGRRVEFSDRGLQLWEADGSMLVDFPTDPTRSSSITGDLLATSLTVSDQLAIRGSNNELAKGASLVLQSGTTSPQSPPTVSVGFETISKVPDPTWDPYKYGFSYDPTWSGGSGCFVTNQNVYGLNAGITRVSKTTGEVLPWSSITYSRLRTANCGLTVMQIGGNWICYGMGQDINGNWYIEGRNLATGAKTLDVQYVNSVSRYTPVIGNDGTNLLVAYMRTADRKVSVHTVNATTGAGIGSILTTNYAMGSGKNELSFVGKGAYDFGTTRIVVQRRGWINTYVYDTAGVHLDTAANLEDWVIGGNSTGMTWCNPDGTTDCFWVYDAVGGKIIRQSNYRWAGTSTSNSTFWVGNTWYDSSTAPAVTFNVITKALTSNVATLTTSAPHGLVTGNVVIVAGVDATFNGTYTLTGYTTSTITYAKTASNVTSTAATGTVGQQSTTHETMVGPLKNFTMAKRQSVTVTIPPLPVTVAPTGDDVNAARVYMAKGPVLPVASKLALQSTLTSGNRVGYYSHSLGTAINVPAAAADASTIGATPAPGSNGFAGVIGAAAVIKSSNNQFSVDGLGAGNWGGITVASNGNVTIHGSDMTDTGWLTTGTGFTATANCTLNSHWVRRIGKMCYGYFNVTMTAALAAGNVGNITLINVPVGWRTSTQNGVVGGGTASVGIDGAVTTANGIILSSTNDTVAAGGVLSIGVFWFID